jgi:hypothetical protein
MTPQQAKKSVPVNLATVPVNVADVLVNPTAMPVNSVMSVNPVLLTPGAAADVMKQREERDQMVIWEKAEAERMAQDVVNGARPRWQMEGPMPYNELQGEVRVLQLMNPKENGLNYLYNPRALPLPATSSFSLDGRSTLDPFDAARPSQSKRAKKKRQR